MTVTDEPPAPLAEERLTTLGASLRTTLDGAFAAERAVARATFPSEGMLRPVELGVEQSRDWTLARLRALLLLCRFP